MEAVGMAPLRRLPLRAVESATCPSDRARVRVRVGRWALSLAIGLQLGAFGAVAHAGPGNDQSVDSWFARIKAATQSASFNGTFVVTGEGAASSSRIVHYGQGKDSFERIEALDGPQRIVLRHNDSVHTVWPQNRVVLIEQRTASGAFPSLGAAAGLRLDDHYRVDASVEGRVAGRDALVLTILPRDEHRFAHRLWVDRKTNLLLRADVLGARQEVLESSSFTDVAIGVRPQPTAVTDSMAPRGPGWRVVRTVMQTSSLDGEGWQWGAGSVPGFRLVSCVRRPMNPESEDGRSPATTALQAVFSDGLASVSVFVEDWHPARHAQEGVLQTGATQTVMKRSGRYWITVVGDVPASTARGFANALQRRSP